MATSLCTRISQSVGGALLSGTTHFEKARGESTTVGVQFVPTEGALEMRAVFKELLLFETMSECELAHRSQAHVL